MFFGCSEVRVKSLYLGVFKTCSVQVETLEILSAYHLCPKPVNKMRRDGCIWLCTIWKRLKTRDWKGYPRPQSYSLLRMTDGFVSHLVRKAKVWGRNGGNNSSISGFPTKTAAYIKAGWSVLQIHCKISCLVPIPPLEVQCNFASLFEFRQLL